MLVPSRLHLVGLHPALDLRHRHGPWRLSADFCSSGLKFSRRRTSERNRVRLRLRTKLPSGFVSSPSTVTSLKSITVRLRTTILSASRMTFTPCFSSANAESDRSATRMAFFTLLPLPPPPARFASHRDRPTRRLACPSFSGQPRARRRPEAAPLMVPPCCPVAMSTDRGRRRPSASSLPPAEASASGADRWPRGGPALPGGGPGGATTGTA